MPTSYVTVLGKAVQRLAQLRGGGSALPGLVVERIDPDFMARSLSSLPRGAVVISGTNGKTTTTKMVVELLESQGLKVFTNRTGSNFIRGVIASLLREVDFDGNLHADIAVLELDEAHAVHFVKQVPPTYSLLLNVMRDQLDRFGEIDATAKLLQEIASATTDTVVLNREDPRIRSMQASRVVYFGLSPTLRHLFPSDDDMRTPQKTSTTSAAAALVTLEKLDDTHATFAMKGHSQEVDLRLQGIYNVYNAAGALALVTAILDKATDTTTLLRALSHVEPAFGRGETLSVHGQPLELVLVKNPGGFRLGLQSFDPRGYATMIAINDKYADGRDMSWLWDVDFDSLRPNGVHMISGIRAYDMALRLQYDEVTIAHVETNIAAALDQFIQQNRAVPKRIYCTYTAMLAIRHELRRHTQVEVVR